MATFTFVFRGLLVLYGLYVLFGEVAGNSQLGRHLATRLLFFLLILVWFAWLFVSLNAPYAWGFNTVAMELRAVQPAWLRVGLWTIWGVLILGVVTVPHLLYRSRRAGDGLVVLALSIALAVIISPLNNLYNVL